jgi:hypothetical protein
LEFATKKVSFPVQKFSSFQTVITAMKIHVSENTKLLLDQMEGFLLEKRGNIEIKVTMKMNALHDFNQE